MLSWNVGCSSPVARLRKLQLLGYPVGWTVPRRPGWSLVAMVVRSAWPAEPLPAQRRLLVAALWRVVWRAVAVLRRSGWPARAAPGRRRSLGAKLRRSEHAVPQALQREQLVLAALLWLVRPLVAGLQRLAVVPSPRRDEAAPGHADQLGPHRPGT